jgi:hypothetical protein
MEMILMKVHPWMVALLFFALLVITIFLYFTPSTATSHSRNILGTLMWLFLVLSLLSGIFAFVYMFWNAMKVVKVNYDGSLDVYYNNGRSEKLIQISKLVARSEGAGGEAVMDWIEVYHSGGMIKVPLAMFEGYPEVRKMLENLEIKTRKKIGNMKVFRMELERK